MLAALFLADGIRLGLSHGKYAQAARTMGMVDGFKWVLFATTASIILSLVASAWLTLKTKSKLIAFFGVCAAIGGSISIPTNTENALLTWLRISVSWMWLAFIAWGFIFRARLEPAFKQTASGLPAKPIDQLGPNQ